MSHDEAKQFLVEKITSLQGCKATALAGDQETVLALQDFSIPDLLDELVEEDRIVEIEYVLPDLPWRAKAFYLPVGTEIYMDAGVHARVNP